jgi:hypothetical protein
VDVRRAGDPPPLLVDKQRAIAQRFGAPWIGPDTTGTSRHLSRGLPGAEARDRRREPGRRAPGAVLTSGRDGHTTAVGSDFAPKAARPLTFLPLGEGRAAGPFIRRPGSRCRRPRNGDNLAHRRTATSHLGEMLRRPDRDRRRTANAASDPQ